MKDTIRFFKLSQDLITDPNLTTYDFRIYVYLMSLYNKEKGCSFPSLETIAEKLVIGLTTVKKSIHKLNDLGYLKIEKQNKKIGHYNKYCNFKHIIDDLKSIKDKIKDNFKEHQLPSSLNDFLEEKVEILSVKERKQKDIDNNISVRIARKYTDIDSSSFAKELLSKLSESFVREGCSLFKNKLELGKLKQNCASNLLRECINVYIKQGVDLPTVVFNKYKKIDGFLVQPSEIRKLKAEEEIENSNYDWIRNMSFEL